MDPDLTIHANMALQVPDSGGSATGMRQVVGHSLCTESREAPLNACMGVPRTSGIILHPSLVTTV
eukprot:6927075-Prymnesium_polylepis.1